MRIATAIGVIWVLAALGCEQQATNEEPIQNGKETQPSPEGTPAAAERAESGSEESPEAKVERAKTVAAQLPSLRRSINHLEAELSVAASDLPSGPKVEAAIAELERSFALECPTSGGSPSPPIGTKEREKSMMLCAEMDRFWPILHQVAEYEVTLALLEAIKAERARN